MKGRPDSDLADPPAKPREFWRLTVGRVESPGLMRGEFGRGSAIVVFRNGALQMEVSFFATCLVDQLFPNVGVASIRLLRKLGVSVEFDPRQTCCGQPALNAGYQDEARRVALQYLSVFKDKERIVVPSGSCATMIKHFLPGLFPEGSEQHIQAQAVAKRTYELSDFIVSELGVTDVGARFEGRVTFHDSCHQLRELGIKEQPRELIQNVRGITLVEMENAERCCGFGGTFAVKYADISVAMGNEKIESVVLSRADYVVANDVSCLMHIEGLMKRKGLAVKTLHLAELLAP